MKHYVAATLLALLSIPALAQTSKPKAADTVVVELAKTSKVVFTMRDRSDLALLRQYDFQALFQDILVRLEKTDSIRQATSALPDTTHTNDDLVILNNTSDDDDDWGDEDNDDNWGQYRRRHYRYRGDRHSFNFDLGTNNYLSSGAFPESEDPYAVRPWGSWYLGINSVQRSQVTNKFYLEWGLGISWYNFKFEDAATRISKNDTGVIFAIDDQPGFSYKKSKLTVSYVNFSLVPMIDFGGYRRKARIWESHNSSFRIGAGPYVGYRIGSHTKVVYKDGNNREKDKDRDSFYLNNLRYGVRLQLGIRSTDFFFNYDLNNLFTNKAGNPNLNAFSFGIIF